MNELVNNEFIILHVDINTLLKQAQPSVWPRACFFFFDMMLRSEGG